MEEKKMKIKDINWLVMKRTPKHNWRYPIVCVQILPVKITDKKGCFVDLKTGKILDEDYFEKIAKEPVGYSGGFEISQFTSKELLLDICKNGNFFQAYSAIYGAKLRCLATPKKELNREQLLDLSKNVNLTYEKIFKPLYKFSTSNKQITINNEKTL